jgi:hypothetical protein
MSVTDITQTAAIIVTIIAFILSQYVIRRRTQADSFIKINNEYNRIVTYRLEHPEVAALANQWRNEYLDSIGATDNITKYYSYGELCIGFCDVCLYHREGKLISSRDFDNYYRGLMDLVATENKLFFVSIAKGKYCSQEFKKWFTDWKKHQD